MKTLFKKVKFYTYVGLVVAALTGLTVGSARLGYQRGVQDNTKQFQNLLVDKDFAEYNSKTGKWQLRDLLDMVPNLDKSSEILFGESELPTKKVAKR